MKTTRQVVLAAPGKMVVQDAPMPAPRAGEALVRVLAVGVCGSDLHMFRHGKIGGITLADAGGPFVPGHECMGRIEDVGAGVDRKLVGRRVFVEPAINCGHCRWCLGGKPNVCPNHTFLGLPPQGGCLTQYMAHPAQLCEELPDSLTDDVGVLLEPLAVAVHSIDRVGPTGGSAVVILGAGPVGLTHAMLLARSGVSPLIVTDIRDERVAAAKAVGATAALNARRDNVAQAVMDATGGDGADFVFECAGEMETFQQMIDLAAPAGRVGVVGIPDEDLLAFKHSVARRKGLDVLMIRRANLTSRRALQWAMDPALPLAPLATHHWPMEKVQEAFETAADYRDGVIKAIVNP